MNKNVIKGKWRELKGDLQKAWGKITDDDLVRTNGIRKSTGGLIQHKYGEAQEKLKVRKTQRSIP